MTDHALVPPLSEAEVRALRVGDRVTLQGTLYGLRDATLIHMFDKGRHTKFGLAGHVVLHTAPNVKKVPASPANPTGYAPFCVGTTTSARMERFTRPLMASLGVRLIIGKGGLGPDSGKAFEDLGGAYLAVIGGAAALETTWIESIEDVDMDDLHPESLWRFRVQDFGPLLVGMDSRGGSLYAAIEERARGRRAAALAALGIRR